MGKDSRPLYLFKVFLNLSHLVEDEFLEYGIAAVSVKIHQVFVVALGGKIFTDQHFCILSVYFRDR